MPLAPLIAGSNSALTARLAALPFEQLLSLATTLHAAQQVRAAHKGPLLPRMQAANYTFQ